MIRSAVHALGLLGLTASLTFASHIVGGMTQYALFSSDGQVFNNNFGNGSTTINDGLDAGNRFGFNGADPITFTGGGSFQTVPFAGTDYNDFHSLTTTLAGLVATPIVSWVGLTPGVYSFTTAPTTVVLATPGMYTFKYVGGTPLTFNNVSITGLDPGTPISSDDIVWYVPQTVNVINSTFAGVLVVDDFGANIEANGGTTTIGGRVLTEAAANLIAWNGGDLSFSGEIAYAPEPSTFLLLGPAFAIGVFARRRLFKR